MFKEETKDVNVLFRYSFMSKLIYYRLLEVFNISNISINDASRLITKFDLLMDENGYRDDVLNNQSLSYQAFTNISEKFINYIKSIDISSLESHIYDITDCLIWANRMHNYCTYIAPDRSIMTIKELKSIRGAFYGSGYTTLLDMASIYTHTNGPQFIKGIGTEKYLKFREFFVKNCKEFKMYEKRT